MNSDLTNQLREYLSLQSRGVGRLDEQLQGWLEGGSNVIQRRERLQAWLASVGAGHSRAGGEFLSTAEVASFMAKLGAIGGGGTILDPACGAGLLLSYAAEETEAAVIHGIELNLQVAGMARLLTPESSVVFQGDSLKGDHALAASYDLIVSEPPFGGRLDVPYLSSPVGETLTQIGDALLSWSISKLSAHGRAVFLFAASCLNSRGDKLWRDLASQGGHVRALIHVPSGQLKATDLESYVVVVDRCSREKVFTAQFGTDAAIQKQILVNYEVHKPGGRPAQGRLVDMADFRGFQALDASERLGEHAKRAGLKPVPMKDLITEYQLLKSAKAPVGDSANDLYLPLAGKCEAVLSREALTVKTVSVVRLVINEELADARFVAASMNHEVGRLFLETVTVPGFGIRRVSLDSILQGTFYLPSRLEQAKVMETVSKVHALRAELDEVESAVWSHPSRIEKEIKQLRLVNHEDSLESWLESIPFPLASILWRFRTSSGSTKEKNEILLHFFEALAEFWATIYLSAAKSDREFWADHVNGLTETVEKAKLTFDQATFGLWKCVIEYFSKKFRHLLDKDPDRCAAMFGTANRDVLNMLFDRRLLTLLQAANSTRNNRYHGGAEGARDIQNVHDQLMDHVQTCRSVMGVTWERYELVLPAGSEFLGGIHHYKVRHIMGTRTPFLTVDRKTMEAMEGRCLHLLDPEGERSLKLLPFVRVMPSPKTEANACYFYNKRQLQNQKFVSYHFEGEPEIDKFFADTQAALEGMLPFGTQSPVGDPQTKEA
jgi:hypothetical protein